jgi:formate/nitrite transporter
LNPESILVTLGQNFEKRMRRSQRQIFILSIIAGCFIALGAAFMILIKSDNSLSFATMSLLCGLAFSLGLFSILGAGGELFTGNCLIFSVLKYPLKRSDVITLVQFLAISWIGNFIGSVFIAILLFYSGFCNLNDGKIAETVILVATTKYSLPVLEMFIRAILCNFLVCLAVFIANSATSLTDKFITSFLPVTAFVACAFEHCIANQTFFTLGLLLSIGTSLEFNISLAILNLIITTLGNLVGGIVLFSGIFYFAAKK